MPSSQVKEPLRKISFYSNFLVTSELQLLNEKAKSSIHKISDASVRMQKLIEGILSYSSYNGQADKKLISLEALFTEALDNLEYQIQETGATIISDVFLKQT